MTLAAQYGRSTKVISDIAQRRSYTWVEDGLPAMPLDKRAGRSATEEQVRNVRRLKATTTMTLEKIALTCGLSRSVVKEILKGRTYKWVM